MNWEPAKGDYIIEKHPDGRERRIDAIHGDRVTMTGVESGRRTTAHLDNVRRRYRLADAPFNLNRRRSGIDPLAPTEAEQDADAFGAIAKAQWS